MAKWPVVIGQSSTTRREESSRLTEASPLLIRQGTATSFSSRSTAAEGPSGQPDEQAQEQRRLLRWKRPSLMATTAAATCVAAAILLPTFLSGYSFLHWPTRPAFQRDGSASTTTNTDCVEPQGIEDHLSPESVPDLFAFPPDFVWGVATSSYQIEGAAFEDGRTPSVWDDFCHHPTAILDGSNGDVACDHYHRMEPDADLIRTLGFKNYRFSVSWGRIVRPDGTVNPPGVDFYNRLIDALLRRGIEPWITMHHWDLPSHLEGGWLNGSTVGAFERYADVLLDKFGDRVRNWITVNEPWTLAVNGYGTGVHAPGRVGDVEPYVVGHHLLLAHARAVRRFRERYRRNEHYKIGIANCGDYRYPQDQESEADRSAAERAMLFQWGWFVHPLVHGDYPSVMREILGSRLPEFTAEERELVQNAFDFLGLNYYSSLVASPTEIPPTYAGYWADIHVNLASDPQWTQNDMGWNVVPSGLRDMLRWISAVYNQPVVYVTENGSAEPEPDLETAKLDAKRQDYFEQHLAACALALMSNDGGRKVNLKGYFVWSLMDNFEWQFGYQRRFGISYVDFESSSPTWLERTPKGSAWFLKETIQANGTNLGLRLVSNRQDHDGLEPIDEMLHRTLSNHRKRPLPERVIVGYGSNVKAVKRAVRDGVNVVIWSFVDFRSDTIDNVPPKSSKDFELDSRQVASREQERAYLHATVVTTLNLTQIHQAIRELDEDGFQHTVHLMSVGGWNGRHLDPNLSALEWYGAYRQYVGDVFHGIDWDLEGNDDLDSPYNVFTQDCLDKMADISRLAKADGYHVGMAPPQSYLDALDGGTGRFSRLVNLTDSSRTWHSEFSYFGANVYAYLLHRAGDWIDLVFLQFYESYSRAHMTILSEGITPASYLERFVEGSLDGRDLVAVVDFSDDPSVKTPARTLRIPLSKLVIGLANGWADNGDDKTLFVSTQEFDSAWTALRAKGIEPRGAGFWTIDEEGTRGAYFARELSRTIVGYSNEIS